MATGQQLIDAARKYLGVPYLYGGTTKTGLDCSGLIIRALTDLGARGQFPRVSSDQIAATTPITVEEALNVPGALVWFDGHDALTVGDGMSTIEAVVNPGRKVAIFSAPQRWTKAGLIPGIDYRKKDTLSAPRKMISPVKASRVSSEYGRRAPIKGVTAAWIHAGIDLVAKVGTQVVAAWGGTVVAAGWNCVAGRTGYGVLIQNPDGMCQYYGHLSRVDVRVGQKVAGGQGICLSGDSGNVTGAHLHFEIWLTNDPTSHRNPRVYFEHWGIKPGSTPVIPSSTKPKAPAKPASPKKSAKVAAPSAGVKRALKAMGLPQTTAGVETYQRHHGLFVDGVWGGVTQRYFEWVKALQKALNAWRAVQPKLKIDGYRGTKTVNAEDAVIAMPLNRKALKIRNGGTQLQKRADLYLGLKIGPVPPKRG